MTPEPTLTAVATEMPLVEIIDTEDVVDTTDQITTPSDVGDRVDPTATPAELLQRRPTYRCSST